MKGLIQKIVSLLFISCAGFGLSAQEPQRMGGWSFTNREEIESKLKGKEKALLDSIHDSLDEVLARTGQNHLYLVDRNLTFLSFAMDNYMLAISTGAVTGGAVGLGVSGLSPFTIPHNVLGGVALGGGFGAFSVAWTHWDCEELDCSFYFPPADHYRVKLNFTLVEAEDASRDGEIIRERISCAFFFDPNIDTDYNISSIRYELDSCSDDEEIFPEAHLGVLRIGDSARVDLGDRALGQNFVILKDTIYFSSTLEEDDTSQQ